MLTANNGCAPYEPPVFTEESDLPAETESRLSEGSPGIGRCVFAKAVGDGSSRLFIRALEAGRGLVIVLTGGDEPHIGAVAIAIPRPSLADPTATSSTTSVYTVTGHKDDEIAKPIAERAARELNRVVVAIAGVHVRRATSDVIAAITRTASDLLDDVIRALGTGATGTAATAAPGGS